MHYDIGTLSLWIGVGVALIVGGIQAAGWRHRVVISALISLGALSIIAALAVPPLADKWPSIARFMSDAATPTTWLVLFLVVAAYLYIGPRAKAGTTAADSEAETIQLSISNLLEAQENRFKGTISSVANHVEQVRKRMDEVERRTAFPPNLGDTLREALESAEGVRLSQIGRIRDEVEKAKESLNNSHLEALYLLDFCINGATRSVCRELLSERPKADRMKPPIDEKRRSKAIDEMRSWLQKVRQITPIAAYGVTIDTGLKMGAQQAADFVRQIPAAERPQGIDALAFHDFFVPAHQCEHVAESLEYVIRELDHADQNCLQRLRECYSIRSPKRP